MALTESTMLKLGSIAPDFALGDPASSMAVKLSDFDGKPLMLSFICNHCPYVTHIIDKFAQLADEYIAKGVAFVAINSNDITTHPDDAPEKMVDFARAHKMNFPYLFDRSQDVARAYKAACTPDLYLFDSDRRLVYRGRFDASRVGSTIPVTGEDLRAALDALLSGAPIPTDQKPSIGCNIKWSV